MLIQMLFLLSLHYCLMMRQLITKTVYDYDEWQVDWDTTKQLIDYLDLVFERLGDDVDDETAMHTNNDFFQDSFVMDGLQILNTAILHMYNNGWVDDYLPADWADMNDPDNLTDEDFVPGPQRKVYVAWMAARAKLASVSSG